MEPEIQHIWRHSPLQRKCMNYLMYLTFTISLSYVEVGQWLATWRHSPHNDFLTKEHWALLDQHWPISVTHHISPWWRWKVYWHGWSPKKILLHGNTPQYIMNGCSDVWQSFSNCTSYIQSNIMKLKMVNCKRCGRKWSYPILSSNHAFSGGLRKNTETSVRAADVLAKISIGICTNDFFFVIYYSKALKL